MRQKTLITSALIYANGPLHFGHLAGAYLPADCYARFRRLQSDDLLYICGSDEYGVAITLSAELAGRTPQEQVDHFHAINKDLLQKMRISIDHYSRTTCPEHEPIVQDFFTTLLKNGFIEEKVSKQLYSEEEKRFLADRYVMGECPKCHFKEARGDECPKCGGNYEATDIINPVSKMTKSKLGLKQTNHWYLRLDLFKERLLAWLETLDWKSNVVNFIKPYIEDLRPRAITRDATWGVKIPLANTEGKVLYVWFDAPIGYISATQEWARLQGDKDRWKDYWLDEKTKYVQFIGKDNIVFHAMFFPAMQMGQDIPYKLVDQLPANEFLNLEGKQFSKSSGWYIDLADFLQKFSVDSLRYTLAANAPENQDAEFTWSDFQMRVNTELVGKFGNFVHRVLSFLTTKMDSKIPECHDYEDADNEFWERIASITKEMAICYDAFKVRKASQLLMELCSLGNAYFDQSKPWELLKDKRNTEHLNTVMYCLLTAIKAIAVVSFPIVPDTASKIWNMLGFKTSLETVNWKVALAEDLEPGIVLQKPVILFEKIEDDVVKAEMEKLGSEGEEIKTYDDLKESIEYGDFTKLDLRVAKIVSAENVPKSKKLLKLSVDLGFETRTIVSGIAEHYTDPKELEGRSVIIVANLKPAKLMGIESQGMILAAGDGGILELPFLHTALPGTTVR